jgi:hypothetical protein
VYHLQKQPTILLGDRIFHEIQMSQSPVTDSLEIILTNITEKLDSLQKDFTESKSRYGGGENRTQKY